MFINNKLSEEEQRKVRVEIMRMKNKMPDEIFSEEYKKNNPYSFEYYFEKNYKCIFKEDVKTCSPNAPTYVLYYNETTKDARICILPDSLEIHPLEIDFISIDDIKYELNQHNSPNYDVTFQNIINKYEEINKQSQKIKI